VLDKVIAIQLCGGTPVDPGDFGVMAIPLSTSIMTMVNWPESALS
jgi:hypothetical protein